LNLTNKKRDLLGSIILKTIRIYDLLDFTELEHNRKYVTPILAQGYIPNKYLEDYFNIFLLPYGRRLLAITSLWFIRRN